MEIQCCALIGELARIHGCRESYDVVVDLTPEYADRLNYFISKTCELAKLTDNKTNLIEFHIEQEKFSQGRVKLVNHTRHCYSGWQGAAPDIASKPPTKGFIIETVIGDEGVYWVFVSEVGYRVTTECLSKRVIEKACGPVPVEDIFC